MRQSVKSGIVAGLFLTFSGGLLPAMPAHAQSIPRISIPAPVVIDVGVRIPPIIVNVPSAGFVFGGAGSERVDVDKDVDRSRTPGRVVIIE